MRLLFAFILFAFSSALFGQAYNIDLKIKNYENDTLIVGYYYGDRQLVKDTLFAESKGKFSFKGQEKLDGGMYILLFKPANNILQFLMPEDDQIFSLECDIKDLSFAKVKGSKDNEAFFGYLSYLQTRRAEADPLRAKIKEAEEKETKDDVSKAKLDKLDKEVDAFREKVLRENPNSVTYQLLRSNIEQDLPQFEGTEEEVQMAKYRYYKKHYFDNIDFAYPSLIRTPYFYDRINTYIEKLTPKAPDSIILSIDYLLAKMKGNEDAYKFCLSTLLNKYAKNKFIGMDAIYVHMIDKYYSNGEADWVDEENLIKMKENANNLRPILIGKVFPNITVYKEDKTPLMIHSVESEYTMVIFWAPDCGHCKKSMPSIIEFYETYKDKGLKVVSICSKGGGKLENCWEFIKEKGMEGFINTGDEHQTYRKYVYVPSTPKIFILNNKKEILIKDVPSEELSNVMDEILKEKQSD